MKENRKSGTIPAVLAVSSGQLGHEIDFPSRTVFQVFHISPDFAHLRNAALDADALWQQDRRR
ncbi:MAG: hypothetical protein WA957_05385 [Alteraurantiacibacter sp.]